jgi:predicted nucleic-acid-binding Zn-ribbon protein
MSKTTEEVLAEAFVCSHCKSSGAVVERIAMSGVGISRLFDIQHHRYAFVSCDYCGYTEIFNLRILEGADDPGKILDILFSLD